MGNTDKDTEIERAKRHLGKQKNLYFSCAGLEQQANEEIENLVCGTGKQNFKIIC